MFGYLVVTTDCMQTLTLTSSPTVIETENYPNEYPPNKQCLWILENNSGLFTKVH